MNSLPTQHRGAPMATPGRAVVDAAHTGDIVGAFGRIRRDGAGAPSGRCRRLRTLMVITGPGLIVMVGDNDAGGVATYAQAGQNYGMALLWTLMLLIPVLYVNQEMVLRLGAVTRVGHARLISERFGRFWGAFSVGDLLILNALTIVTEFIGVALALGFLGCPKIAAIPAAAVLLFAVVAGGSFRRWEALMFLLIAVNVLIVPMVLPAHPTLKGIGHGLIPQFCSGLNSTVLLLVIAIVGTTVAPWQLFFQQSNLVDKRITSRLGAVAGVLGGAAVIVAGRRYTELRDAEAIVQTLGSGLDREEVDEVDDAPLLTRAERRAVRRQDRMNWPTPDLAGLPRPAMSPVRRAGLFALRSYLVVAAVLVVVKLVQSGIVGPAASF